MAPLHHHFELKGWPETTVTSASGSSRVSAWLSVWALFYADFLSTGSLK